MAKAISKGDVVQVGYREMIVLHVNDDGSYTAAYKDTVLDTMRALETIGMNPTKWDAMDRIPAYETFTFSGDRFNSINA